jgi:hypothetical protein
VAYHFCYNYKVLRNLKLFHDLRQNFSHEESLSGDANY